MPATEAPLQGLRVVDTTDGRGSLTTRLLADLGAEVILLEAPGGGRLRSQHPRSPDGHSLAAAWRHANKIGDIADLTTPEGRGHLERLLDAADIWVDGHSMTELETLGLDLAGISAQRPQLIVVSVTDFGLFGPYAEFVATDASLSAIAGMIFKAGVAHKPPLLTPTPLTTDVAGVAAAVATLLAVEQRQRIGEGQLVDVGVMAAAAATTDWSYSNASVTRAAGAAYGETRQGGGFLYPVFRCNDGYVRMIMMTPRQWHSLLDWMGNPEEWMDPHWEHFVNRMGALDILCDVYEAFFADKNMLELCAEAQSRGIVATPVLRPAEILTDGHLHDRGTFVNAEIFPGVPAPIVSGFFEVNGVRHGFRTRAPEPGEHQGASFTATGIAEPTGVADPDARPLSGVRVLDFGIGGVGVEASRLLGEYGADVIKVESRTYPDFIRMVLGSEMTPSFASSSRSKRSLGINLKTEAGLDLMTELIRHSDIIIENSATGTMDSMGVGYRRCAELNPGIIMVSSQLLGSRGRSSDWIGYGPSTQPYGGLVHLWDYDDDDPAPAANTTIFPDHLAGRLVALGAIAALIGRRRTGRGAHVEVAQVEAVINLLAEPFLAEALQPGSAPPRGNRRPDGAPWGPFPCAGEDRWCVVCVETDPQWDELVTLMGDPAWARNDRFVSAAGRLEHADELEAHVAEWTRTQEPEALQESCQAVGIPAGVMQTGTDLLDDPHLIARGWTLELDDHPGVGPITLEGPAFAGGRLGEPITFPAPGLGQHTREIAAEVLGLSDSRIDELIAEGALEVDTATTG